MEQQAHRMHSYRPAAGEGRQRGNKLAHTAEKCAPLLSSYSNMHRGAGRRRGPGGHTRCMHGQPRGQPRVASHPTHNKCALTVQLGALLLALQELLAVTVGGTEGGGAAAGHAHRLAWSVPQVPAASHRKLAAALCITNRPPNPDPAQLSQPGGAHGLGLVVCRYGWMCLYCA